MRGRNRLNPQPKAASRKRLEKVIGPLHSHTNHTVIPFQHFTGLGKASLGSLGRPKGGRCDTYQFLAMLAGTKIRYRPEVRRQFDVIQAALFDLLLILTEQSELAIRRVSPRSVSRSRRQISGKTKIYSKTRNVMRYQVVSKRDIEYRLISIS